MKLSTEQKKLKETVKDVELINIICKLQTCSVNISCPIIILWCCQPAIKPQFVSMRAMSYSFLLEEWEMQHRLKYGRGRQEKADKPEPVYSQPPLMKWNSSRSTGADYKKNGKMQPHSWKRTKGDRNGASSTWQKVFDQKNQKRRQTRERPIYSQKFW